MEQPKKPGPGRDIADLKARLGLSRPGAPAPGQVPMPGPAMPGMPMVPSPSAVPSPMAPIPSPAAPPPPQPAPQPAAAPVFNDPFASMRPPEGKHFDLRSPQDDGRPSISVQRGGGLAARVILVIAVLIASAVGFGFGASAVGRRMYNSANYGAKRVKAELDEMQKTISEIGTAVAFSQQKLQNAKKDPLSYDPELMSKLAMVKLDPRPDTSRIFKVNYYLLEDLAVDRLMTYYYDAIVLYGEVERHIKRTKADKASLETFASKMADGSKPAVNYGVVFSSAGKLAIGSLVEIGKPVCKGGGDSCSASDYEGFMIRSNTGAPWTARKIGPKPEGDKVVPVEKTPLFEAVMSGSPDQVRMEQYKQRYNTIRQILARLAATRKELVDAIDKAAARPDLFTF